MKDEPQRSVGDVWMRREALHPTHMENMVSSEHTERKFMPRRNPIDSAIWDEQADYYELGFKHAREIARELGVSPQTVCREMKKRSAIKGSRVSESIADLEAFLDRRAKRAELQRLAKAESIRKKGELAELALDRMMASLIAADREGDLGLASEHIEKTATAFGVRLQKRPRRA